MLVIRQAQIDAFGEMAVGDFKQRLAAHLKIVYPDETASFDDGAFAAFIDEEFENAKKYNALAESQFHTYIECALQYGSDFVENEALWWAKDYLVVAQFSATRKFELVRENAGLRCEVVF